MFFVNLLKDLWQFALDNAEIAVFLATCAMGGLTWFGQKTWKRFKRQRLRILDIDTFPFEVISPGREDVVQQIYGSAQQAKDDPLADFNIPYQQRSLEEDVQQVLMARVRTQWLLILGATGLGKTREAAKLAETHSGQGWTVLRLKNHELLAKPDSFPADRLGTQPKLLFVLDDLNQAVYLGQHLPRVDDEGKKAEAIKSPLQDRLLETLDYYVNACGADKVRVVATARNERTLQQGEEVSQWEKLGIDKYRKFWTRFDRYELSPPEERAVAGVLVETANRAQVSLKQADLAQMVGSSDRTFRNLVENLRGAKSRKETLSVETFSPTMQGTWEDRYRNAKKQYSNSAVLIYDAVDLLRRSGVLLHPLAVMSAVKLLTKANKWQWWWQQRQISATLTKLTQSEDILEPRDGQIEAKGTIVSVGAYIEPLAKSLPKELPPQVISLSLWSIACTAYEWQKYRLILSILDFLEQRQEAKFFDRFFALRGVALSGLNEKAKALDAYDAAIAISFDDHEAFYNKGNALAALGRTEDAIAAYEDAIALKPDYHQAFSNKGNALAALGRTEDAIAAYDAAIAIKPDDHEAFSNKGVALAALGRTEDAIAAYDAAIAIKPDYHEAFSNKGSALAALGRTEDAIAAFEAAIAIKPDFHEAIAAKGIALYTLERYTEAIATLELVSKIQPNYLPLELSIIKGIALTQLRQYDETIHAISPALENNPDSLELLTLQSNALHGLGRYQEAILVFDKALELSPDDADTHYNKACSHALLNQIDNAIASLQKAIALDNTNECIEMAKTDTDFDAIRDRPQFQTFLAQQEKVQASKERSPNP